MSYTSAVRLARRVGRRGTVGMVTVLAASGIVAYSASASSSHAAASSAAFVKQAKAAIEAATGPQNKWTGPTSGLKPQPGKSIVYIEADGNLALGVDWGKAMQQAAKSIGWKVTILDGMGTTQGWTQAFSQAIALKPDGIVTSANTTALKKQTAEAAKAGITVIGMEATPFPGPNKATHEFTNITTSPVTIAKAMVNYAVAKSNGHAKIMIIYDGQYISARIRNRTMINQIKKCGGCKLLADANSPFTQASTLMPTLFNSWRTKFGTGWWVLSVDDGYYDFAVPALRSAGVPPNAVHLVAADGSTTAYQRISQGQYQVATIPAPALEQGYQVIDEFNRAFHGQKWSGFSAPLYIVDKSNVTKEGGNKQVFNPSNNFVEHYQKIWGVKG